MAADKKQAQAMANRSATSRKARLMEKTNYLYVIYKLMGEERSLAKLYEICQAVGIRTSEKSIQGYSARFNWQARLLEDATKDKGKIETDLKEAIEKMNQRHANVAQGLMGLVVSGIQNYQKITADLATKSPNGSYLFPASPTDIARIYEAAQRGERLARGQATSRIEVWADVTETVVKEFALIFLAVNGIATPEEREREFVRMGDDMVKRYYLEQMNQKGRANGV